MGEVGERERAMVINAKGGRCCVKKVKCREEETVLVV